MKEEIKSAFTSSLIDAKEILDSLGITFWLTDGTLLGAYRENDFIAHDHDMDIAMFVKDYTPKIIEEFKKKGFELIYFPHEDLPEKIHHSFGRGGNSAIDIFFFYEAEDHFWCSLSTLYGKTKYTYDKDLNFKKVNFKGYEFNIPENTLKYLKTGYGNFWNVPDREWTALYSPRNIVDAPWLRTTEKVIKESYYCLSQIARYAVGPLVQQYSQNFLDISSSFALQQIRRQIVDFFLTIPAEEVKSAYLGAIGGVWQALLDSGIRYEPILSAEQTVVDEFKLELAQVLNQPNFINYILAIMLYQGSEQIALQPDITCIPIWFLDSYLSYILKAPTLFKEFREVENYLNYLDKWVDFILVSIKNNPESDLWKKVGLNFLFKNDFYPLYLTTKNLKDIYIKRADLIDLVLTLHGCSIDYEFPEREIDREKIRLGIIADKFDENPETYLIIPIFEYLDKNRFEIILYTPTFGESSTVKYCQSLAERVVTLPDDVPKRVEMIREDDLDILVLGSNITKVKDERFFRTVSHRLARVQVAMGCSPTTTGIRNVDYYIAGDLAQYAPEDREQYREKLITIQGTGYCYKSNLESGLTAAQAQAARNSLGIPEEAVVFISGTNYKNIIPELRETWAQIIAAVPNAVLVLYPFRFEQEKANEIRYCLNNMKKVFASHDLEEERVFVISNKISLEACLEFSDIYLDNYIYTDFIANCAPLLMGIPTIVMNGNTLRTKVGAATLTELGVTDLIADNEAVYMQLAIALGKAPELREQKGREIKEKLQGMPRFLDSQDYSGQMAALFEELCKDYQESELVAKYKLRKTNLIIFPDWSQLEESLYEELATVIKVLVDCRDRNQITLLIDTSNITEEDADLAISSIFMELLMAEDLDTDSEPNQQLEISLIGQASQIEWQVLLKHTQGRILLHNENQQLMLQVKADLLPSYNLGSFTNKTLTAITQD